jgi:hypothetical protein
MNRIERYPVDPRWLTTPIQYNGAPRPRTPEFKKGSFSTQLFYTEEYSNLNVLLSALVSAQVDVRAVDSLRSGPDYRCMTNDGSVVFVEVKTVFDRDSVIDSKILDLSVGVSERCYSDPEIESKLQGYNVTFFLSGASAESDYAALFDEILAFLAREPLSRFISASPVAIGHAYPTLSSVGSKVFIRSGLSTSVSASRGAMSIAPPHLQAYEVLRILPTLRHQVQTWRLHPLWGVLWSTSIYAPFALSELEHMLLNEHIEPLDRLFIGNGAEVLSVNA